jgi:hypothetical protein
MMSAGECRAKALEAVANAAKDASPKGRLDWETMGHQWTDMANRIDVIESMQTRLNERDSS